MNVLFLVVAGLVSLLFITGWLMLLSMPVVALSAATVGGVAGGVRRLGRLLPSLSRERVPGILAIEGLDSDPRPSRRLRSELSRVLRLVPGETRPRACACIKESGGAFLGVLRVFNKQGHYLLRASGESAAAVAGRFAETLGGFTSAFPARYGVRRVQCPECTREACPLRRLRAVAA
jgi:hypothetical protein